MKILVLTASLLVALAPGAFAASVSFAPDAPEVEIPKCDTIVDAFCEDGNGKFCIVYVGHHCAEDIVAHDLKIDSVVALA